MKAGFILPGGSGPLQLDQAVAAEEAGWDAVFVWEAGYGVDAWSLLAAMAARTSRIRLGTVLTPLPWRRPWKVASQVATLDQLSSGRAILTVGVGAISTDLPMTGEVLNLRERAARMDEGIDLIRTLWSGKTHFEGRYYSYACDRKDLTRAVQPVQEPIPIWVVGVWPRPKSMRRVTRCEGVVPQWHLDGREGRPDDVREMRAWLKQHGAPASLDVIAEGETPPDDAAAASAHVSPWADAGCTWWLETRWEMPHDSAKRRREVAARLAAGAPKV